MPSPPEPSLPVRPDQSEESDKIPPAVKAAYGFGGMNDMFGHWLYGSLARPVFNMQLGLAPTLIGAILMIARLCDGMTDTLFGWLSDNTRSRWGRRRPYILVGSIAAGAALPCLFLASSHWNPSLPWFHNRLFWFMLASAVLYAPIIGMYSMPYASLGSELTPNYHERTSVMAFKAFMQKIAGVYVAGSWWIARSFGRDPITGRPDILAGARFAAAVAGAIMILAGVGPFLFVKERYYQRARTQEKTRFWATCRETYGFRPFGALLAIVVVFAMSTSVANDLGQYAGTYFVFGGDIQVMARFYFYSSLGQFVLGVAAVFLASWLARHLGKRRALLAALGCGVLAYGSSWWLYAPGAAWLFVLNASLTVVASTGVWVLAPSMVVDVVDAAELRTGQRREGAFNSWLSWSIKLGLALSLLASGLILDGTGFRASAAGGQAPAAIWWIRFWFAVIPVAALSIGILLVGLYPLSQKRVLALRLELEAKRGKI